VEVGGFYTGTVRRILGFGAIVELFPGTDGLVHISQLAEGHVKEVSDVLKEGDEVLVKVIDIDPQGRIRLSRKAALKEKRDETKDKG
jgi:polyribonucleotide nucleotidyltransferase